MNLRSYIAEAEIKIRIQNALTMHTCTPCGAQMVLADLRTYVVLIKHDRREFIAPSLLAGSIKLHTHDQCTQGIHFVASSVPVKTQALTCTTFEASLHRYQVDRWPYKYPRSHPYKRTHLDQSSAPNTIVD
jgi:hypothetical protein